MTDLGKGIKRSLGAMIVIAVGFLVVLVWRGPTKPSGAAPYRPSDAHEVVERVPRRDPAEVSARRTLIASPDRIEVAVQLARASIVRARRESDPRFLGQAQAVLGPWWDEPAPPVEVLFLRAVINQGLHEFDRARDDLDQLVTRTPNDVQAHLTRAAVAMVTADHAAVRASCAAVERLASSVVAATCVASVDAMSGRADDAYLRLARLLATPPPNAAIHAWALTQLGELAVMRGDYDLAEQHFREALRLEPDDPYTLGALADAYLASGRPAEASALLLGREHVDGHLLRRAIAEHQIRGPDTAVLVGAMRERIAAAAARGDSLHLREEARFALEVDQDGAKALRLAQSNWSIQKEIADARLLAAAARSAGDVAASRRIRAWIEETGVRDAELDRAVAELREPS